MKNFVFQFRRGTSAEWSTINPTLRAGEIGFVLDTQRFKIGNGLTSWNDLPYFDNHNLVLQMIEDAAIEGPPGPQGPAGPTGPQGAPGTSYTGPTISVSDTAPSSPSTGDVWIDTSA